MKKQVILNDREIELIKNALMYYGKQKPLLIPEFKELIKKLNESKDAE